MTTPGFQATSRPLRALWIVRQFPFPRHSGDHIYSAGLIGAVAGAGVELTVAGFPPESSTDVPADWPVRWQPVEGIRHGALRAVCNTLPHVAATHATPAFRRLLRRLAGERWDFVVIDHYGVGWAAREFVTASSDAARPLLMHVAHNHEASVSASLAHGFQGSFARRLAVRQNAIKTRLLERRLVRLVDLVGVITAEDARRFAADAPSTRHIVLTPGHAGVASSRANIDAAVPRRVVMVGSYWWLPKQQNLRRFVAVADPVFARHGIELHVVGSMPEALAQELRTGTRATVIHGFVDDVAPHLAAARIAVVPEEIGGGFKLKFLDYIFGRVAVATLAQAAAGLPEEIRRAMICRNEVGALAEAVAAAMDDVGRLDAMQAAAFAAAQARYRWADRGRDLVDALEALIEARAGGAAESLAATRLALGLHARDAGVGGIR